jgi:uncharacterized protein involved in exopolysaccharide biosynthesis
MTNATEQAQSSPEKYTLRDVLTVLFRHRALIISFFIATLAIAVLGITLAKPRYRVSAALLVKEGRGEVPLTPSESGQIILNAVSKEVLNSEITILTSRSLIESVVRSLGYYDRVPPPPSLESRLRAIVKGWLGVKPLPYGDAMVLEIQDKLSVNHVRNSNIISVSYEGFDAAEVTALVRALTEEYLQMRTSIYKSPQAVPFFDEQMKSAEVRLKSAERAVREYLDSADVLMVRGPEGLDSLAAQKEEILGRLESLRSELVDAELDIREWEQALAVNGARLATEPERLPSASRDHQDATTEEIEKALAALYMRRDALSAEFTADNSLIQDIEGQIDLAEARLEAAEAKTGGINRTELNKVHQDLKAEYIRAEAGLKVASARRESLQKQIAKYDGELARLNEKSFGLEVLLREAEWAEESFKLHRKKHEEARISAAMDQEQIVNVSIAEPAQPPLSPVSAGRTLKLALATFLGLLGGIALAFAREYLDHSVTNSNSLEKHLGILHLASVPEVAGDVDLFQTVPSRPGRTRAPILGRRTLVG